MVLTAACHVSHEAPDAGDGGPPQLISVAAPTWLHEAPRLVFDQPVDPTALGSLSVAVTLAGVPLGAAPVMDGDRTIAIVIDPAARGVGELAVHVAGTVLDLDGRAGAVTADTGTTLSAWSALPIDRGQVAASPALAVTPLGGVYATWTVGPEGGRRVIAALLDRGEWQVIGAPLGEVDASSASLALDANSTPVVAWSDAGVAHVARWDGSAWQALASPGAGTAVAIASPDPGGAPIVAMFGTTIAVRTLGAGDVWQPLGDDAALASFVGEPQLAVAARDRVAVGWIDATATLRVVRWDGTSWTPLAPLALGVPPRDFDRMSLAARGDKIAVAWDQYAGSFGVLAAEVAGAATAWTRLGRALDVDIAGDATAPAIAIDHGGHAIVGWTELIETAQRGVIARWSGVEWKIVGGPTWLPDPAAAPTRATLALHEGDAPVVGTSAAGVLAIARFDGPAVAGPGLAARASIAGCAFSAATPPVRLVDTGCFAIDAPGQATPHPGLVPYDVVVELWSDGAKKRRWIALPDGATMTTSSTGAWSPPPGAFMIKEFALETTPRDPSTRRAIETRFLVLDAVLGWQGFSYRWNPAGTDATLEPDGEDIYAWPMDDGTTHAHLYPSRSECLSCHQAAYGPLLGLRAPQLARWFDYNGVIADQPATLAALGVGPAGAASPFASPHDPSETVERRMRGYMAANCAHCHNPEDVSIHDLRYPTPLAQTNLCPDITPGDPAGSTVYQLVSSRPGMPPLATLAVDPLAVQLLGTWIARMTSCP
jgi:hypothetical protein